MKTLKDRLQFLESDRGISQAEATRRGGFSNAAFINDIFRGHKLSVQGGSVAKLALAYRTTARFILGDTDDPSLPGNEDAINLSDFVKAKAPDFVEAKYAGVVEAGSYRAVADFEDDPNREKLFEPRDPRFPSAKLVYFNVAGDSMNALKPRPIFSGDRVVCIDYESLGGRVPVRDDMVVVVEQTLDGGHHRERSVKQVELFDERIEFHPRSINKRHRPIVVPIQVFRDPSEADHRQVVVLAIVRRISSDLPI